jgi:hypothetical protein
MPAPAKCWKIHKAYTDDVRTLVRDYFDVTLEDPKPSRNEREGNTHGDAFSEPRTRTTDGIEALRAALQAAQAKNAQLDLQVRLARQGMAALQSQLEMERAGRGAANGRVDDGAFSVRGFLRLFGSRGFKSLVRVAHPDLNADKLSEANAFTQQLTKLAAEMGID